MMEKKDTEMKDKNEKPEDLESKSTADNTFIPDEAPEEIEEGDPENFNDQKIIELTEEVAKLNDVILRERAEFVNYRKRINQENLQQEGRTAGKILQELVPVFDGFDQLLTSGQVSDPVIEKFLEGSRLIRKQLWQVFENLGVEEVNPEQQEFDPATMEALSVSESEGIDKEIVKQVYQKGYKYKERILRPARVAVEKPKSSAGQP